MDNMRNRSWIEYGVYKEHIKVLSKILYDVWISVFVSTFVWISTVGAPNHRGPFLRILTIRIIVYWGPFLGSLFMLTLSWPISLWSHVQYASKSYR